MGLPAFVRSAAIVATCSLVLFSSAARADVYGYIDEQGIGHFSTEQLDERYQLFLKGNKTFDTADLMRDPAQQAQDAALEKMAQSPLFRHLAEHPNLKKYEKLLNQAAEEYSIAPALLKAVMAAESGFNPQALSPKGAVGLMQIMPATAQWLGLKADRKRSIAQKLTDPKTNIRLGARYLKMLTERFPDNLDLVLAAYNAGEGAVQRYNNSVPPFRETQNYVRVVSQFYELYQPKPMLAGTAGMPPKRVTMIIPGQSDAPQSSGQ
jgi:soluble lytic murein transglycosylase-like protein